MAQGFATIQRNTTNETTGYTTLFEKITAFRGSSVFVVVVIFRHQEKI